MVITLKLSVVDVRFEDVSLSTVLVEDGTEEAAPVDTVPCEEVPDDDVPVDIVPGDEVADSDVAAGNVSVENVDGALFAWEESLVEIVMLCIATVGD